MIRTVTIVGGGTAGLLSALTLRQQLPGIAIRVVHSRDIGIIGVGEGTTPLFPRHLLETLKLDPHRLFGEASPTWKLGIRFLWGPRPIFYYSFTQQFQARWSDLPQSHGFYLADTYVPADLSSALMAGGEMRSAPPGRSTQLPRRHRAPCGKRPPRRLARFRVPRCRSRIHRGNRPIPRADEQRRRYGVDSHRQPARRG
jgi:hypothetical protein